MRLGWVSIGLVEMERVWGIGSGCETGILVAHGRAARADRSVTVLDVRQSMMWSAPLMLRTNTMPGSAGSYTAWVSSNPVGLSGIEGSPPGVADVLDEELPELARAPSA